MGGEPSPQRVEVGVGCAGQPCHLVIVDDEPAILDLLVSLFDEGFRVEAFARGADALAHMEREGVDVLLTDKNLPDVGGLDLLDAAKRLQPDAEVLLITGYASLDTAVTALQRGAFDYIVKPPRSIFDVRHKVEQAFAKQRVARENRRLVVDLRVKNRELEEALEALQARTAELVQSEKLAGIGTLAAGIAHEINSPLFGILGLAEAIAEETDLDLARTYASEIVGYSRAIKEIVSQLSGYTRDTRRAFLTAVDAAEAVTDALKLLERSGAIRPGVVDVALEGPLPLTARAGELQQVVVNLVRNAVDAAGGGDAAPGAVRLRGAVEGGSVVITVEDDGPGIPEARRREVFDPFYTTKPPGQGTGLGLHIVWRLVGRYQGTVEVDEAASGGALFTVRLPCGA
jgi:C4-dicarboxylate-specific signal transduction histidine kinase